jgi:hypothetical protein
MKAIKAAVSTSFLALPTNLSLVVVLALLLGLPAVGRAGPVSYTFTSIAETGGLISGLSFTPTISGDGTVAFLALVSPGPIGIFAGTGGPLTTIAAPSPFGGGGFGVPPFSNVAGTVVFYATAPSGVPFGIFTGNGGPLTPLYNSSAFRALGTAPTLNSAGTAAFVADPGAGAPSGVFTGNGGPVTAIADSLTFFNFRISPLVNDAGTVVFVAQEVAGGATGVFTGAGGPVTTVAVTGTRFSAIDQYPSMNDSGVVAFSGGLAAGGEGVFTAGGGGIATVADTSGAFSGFAGFSLGSGPSINNAGTVAFFATLDAGGSGIFTGSDPTADAVIRTGDALFGAPVTALDFFRGLNDAGQMAFIAELADGRQVVVRADPAQVGAVPGPSALALLAIGTLALAGYRWKRRRR